MVLCRVELQDTHLLVLKKGYVRHGIKLAHEVTLVLVSYPTILLSNEAPASRMTIRSKIRLVSATHVALGNMGKVGACKKCGVTTSLLTTPSQARV